MDLLLRVSVLEKETRRSADFCFLCVCQFLHCASFYSPKLVNMSTHLLQMLCFPLLITKIKSKNFNLAFWVTPSEVLLPSLLPLCSYDGILTYCQSMGSFIGNMLWYLCSVCLKSFLTPLPLFSLPSDKILPRIHNWDQDSSKGKCPLIPPQFSPIFLSPC